MNTLRHLACALSIGIVGFLSIPARATSFTLAATPNPVAPGNTITFSGNIDAGVTAPDAKVTLWFYNSSGANIGSASETGLKFTSGSTTSVSIPYATSKSLAVGVYTYNLSVYDSGGTGIAGQSDDGGFAVANATGASLSMVCANAVVVGLTWKPVPGATHYTLTRNGNAIAIPSNGLTYITYTNWTDQGVTQNTNYTYVLTALSATNATVLTQSLSVTTPGPGTNGDPSYCPSTVITGMAVGWPIGINQQDGSDLWSQTLGSDGNEYGFFGDGGGFGGEPDNVTGDPGRVSWGIGEIISSTPGDISNAYNVYGGEKAQHPANISGKATSLLAIGKNFYAIGGVWPASGSGTSDSPNHQEIVYSIGNAYSWVTNGNSWTFCTNAQNEYKFFCPGSFLQNGAAYAGNTDGYVYIYGATAIAFFENGPSTAYLWRVKPAGILDDTQYQAFTGLDENGDPIWQGGSFSLLNSVMAPVFTANGKAAFPLSSVVYNAGLNRYIASSEGDVNGVAFYEAPNPWGPWAAIGALGSGFFSPNANNSGGWGNLGTVGGWAAKSGAGCGINFAPKWTSADGKTMWIVFSSNGLASSSASLVSLQGQELDSFSAVPVTFTTSP